MKRFYGLLSLAAASTLLFTASASCDEVTGGSIKSPVKGKVHTGYASMAASATATIVSVPAGQVFVVTQACAYTDGTATAEMRFFVGATKNIAGLLVGQATQCVSFDPGVVLGGGDSISCQNGGSANGQSHCQITGIFSTP